MAEHEQAEKKAAGQYQFTDINATGPGDGTPMLLARAHPHGAAIDWIV